MKWMNERDLLIAQTMAFVQSVAGNKPDAEQPVAAPDSGELDGIGAATDALAFTSAAPPKAVEIPRINTQGDYRSEIQSRVASFRAHQQRISREREAYCSATLARIHATIGNDGAPLRK